MCTISGKLQFGNVFVSACQRCIAEKLHNHSRIERLTDCRDVHMNRTRSHAWLWLAMGFIPSMFCSQVDAQLAPTGGHYAGRPSDTGYEPGMVNASGGYTVSVPLDLPAVRGGLPVPLRISSG